MEKIAEETGFSKEFVENTAEYSTAKNSLLFNLVINRCLNERTEPTPSDMIYFAQAKIIKDLAERENCVIVGRCSDYILRDRKDCLNVFICSDEEDRAHRILERYGKTDKPIQKRIADKDARRKTYYSHYTDRSWGIPQNYDLCLNSGSMGEEMCVKTIVAVFNSFCQRYSFVEKVVVLGFYLIRKKMILSNTCSINKKNSRLIPNRNQTGVLYAPENRQLTVDK